MVVLAVLGVWFVAALGLGIVLGKLISAHERAGVWAIETSRSSRSSTSRAA